MRNDTVTENISNISNGSAFGKILKYCFHKLRKLKYFVINQLV